MSSKAVYSADPFERYEDPFWLLEEKGKQAYPLIEQILWSPSRVDYHCQYIRALGVGASHEGRGSRPETGASGESGLELPGEQDIPEDILRIIQLIASGGLVPHADRVEPGELLALLRHPDALLHAHLSIAASDSEYWQDLGPPRGMIPRVGTSATRAKQVLQAQPFWAGAVAAAAVILLALGVWRWGRPAPATRPGDEWAAATRQIAGVERELAALNTTVQRLQSGGAHLRAGGGEAPPRRLDVPYCTGKVRALVVGVRAAPGAKEIFAGRDAARFTKQVLIDQLAVSPDDIELLAGEDLTPTLRQLGAERLPSRQATQTALQQALEDLKSAGPNDFVIVNVICHGERDSRGRVLLQLADGSLPAEEVLARLNLVPCALKLCIVDACFGAAVSWQGVGDRARTLAARQTQPGPGQPLYPAIFLSSASSDQKSYHSEETQGSVFQQALREVFREAGDLSSARRGYVSPADVEQRLNVRVAQLLAGHGEKETAQICLWSDGMKLLPLFAAADAPPPFGKLTIVGPELSDARIEMDGRLVTPGFTLHQPSGDLFAVEPYWAFRVSGGSAAGERIVVLGLSLAPHPYRLAVTTRDGRAHASSFRLTRSGATQTIELGAPARVATPPGEPAIRITKISQREGRVCGLVSGVADPEHYSVLVLIKTSEWYPHPYLEDSAKIAADGSWELAHVVRGSESRIAALLVRREDAEVPILRQQGYVVQLAQLGGITVAKEELEYQSEFRRVEGHGSSGKAEPPASDAPPVPLSGGWVPPPPPSGTGR